MNSNMPRTPFSTPLSGSARETEIRLKNIFSGPKKRPPVLFLALMFSVCIFCGNLVSCQTREPSQPDAPDVPLPDASAAEPADEEARWTLYWEKAIPKLLEQRDDYSTEHSSSETLLSKTGEERNLLLLSYNCGAHTGGFYNLLLGAFDQEGNLVDYYNIGGDSGVWTSWDERDGLHLVCANSTTYQGWEGGGLPSHFRFDGKSLEAVDLPQSIVEPYNAEENAYKYLPIPGAVEVYRRTPGWDNMSPEWNGVPQWEYQGTVPLTAAHVDPIPAAVRETARSYLDNATLTGSWSAPMPTTGTPILRIEQEAEWSAKWNEFSLLSLCGEWKKKENLTLAAWDVEYGDPGEGNSWHGYAHLLFLQEGEQLTCLTSFYDYNDPLDFPPEGPLAGLSPYNWYAVEALYNAGYLTARPKLADIFTKVPAPAQAWDLAAERYEAEGVTAYTSAKFFFQSQFSEGDLSLETMTPRYFCVEEPYWIGVYTLESSRYENGQWVKQPARLAFFQLSSFRLFSQCVYILPESEVTDVEKQARAAAHGLLDYDVALWDRSVPAFVTAYGPGHYDGALTAQGSDQDGSGGAWTEWGDRYEAQYRLDGWSSRFCTRLDTTRRLPTTRGIKVGDSRAAVRAAYPEIKSEPYPGLEGDTLWYEGYRSQLVFFFEDGKVSRLLLTGS